MKGQPWQAFANQPTVSVLRFSASRTEIADSLRRIIGKLLFSEDSGQRPGSISIVDMLIHLRCIFAINSLAKCSNLSYRIVIATAASATGNDQAQSPSQETAAVATTQPARKPSRR